MAQSEVLLTNGKIKKVYVFNLDFYHLRYGKHLRPNSDESKVRAIENETETIYLKAVDEIQKKYDARFEDFKRKGRGEEKTLNFLSANEVNRAAELEKVRKVQALKIARLRYTGLRKTRRENVFSITSADGKEEVIYSSDTLGFLDSSKVDVEFNVGEMRRFIKGEQDGRKVKSPLSSFVGGGFGLAGGIFGAFWGPVIPATYLVVVAVKKNNKALERQVPLEQLRDDIPYMDGFNRTAKKQKVKNAALGSLLGLAIGVTGYVFILRPGLLK